MKEYNNISKNRKYYESLDGLRVIACFGIIIMHIRANTSYNISDYVWNIIIPSWTWFVYLFLIISGFGMCVGYLSKFNNNIVNLEEFYKKRYKKVFPFFLFLVIIAIIFDPNISSIYEGTMLVTLIYGLLPNNNFNILGVSWTLGVIFLFYLLFPFFSVLLKNKKRAIICFIISLWINYICSSYFFGNDFVTSSFTPRHSFIYCSPLFIAGGIIYLYRNLIDKICEKFRWALFTLCIFTSIIWYITPENILGIDILFIKTTIVFILWSIYAVGVDSKILSNKIMKYFSRISMEMYLSHMVIFRLIEKLNLLYIFGDTNIEGYLSIIFVFLLDIIGMVIFIKCYNIFIKFVKIIWRELNLFIKSYFNR